MWKRTVLCSAVLLAVGCGEGPADDLSTVTLTGVEFVDDGPPIITVQHLTRSEFRAAHAAPGVGKLSQALTYLNAPWQAIWTYDADNRDIRNYAWWFRNLSSTAPRRIKLADYSYQADSTYQNKIRSWWAGNSTGTIEFDNDTNGCLVSFGRCDANLNCPFENLMRCPAQADTIVLQPEGRRPPGYTPNK